MVKQDIRAQIMEAAQSIFARFGFQKTTMDEIAQSLHKGKSSLYYYFRSKEEIFEEILRKEYSYGRQRLAEALKAVSSPVDKLKAYVITRLHVLSELSIFYMAIRDDYFAYLAKIEELRKEYIAEEVSIFEGLLRDGAEQGVFKPMDFRATAEIIINVLKGAELDWGVAEDKEALESNILNVMDMFLYGIVK